MRSVSNGRAHDSGCETTTNADGCLRPVADERDRGIGAGNGGVEPLSAADGQPTCGQGSRTDQLEVPSVRRGHSASSPAIPTSYCNRVARGPPCYPALHVLGAASAPAFHGAVMHRVTRRRYIVTLLRLASQCAGAGMGKMLITRQAPSDLTSTWFRKYRDTCGG